MEEHPDSPMHIEDEPSVMVIDETPVVLDAPSEAAYIGQPMVIEDVTSEPAIVLPDEPIAVVVGTPAPGPSSDVAPTGENAAVNYTVLNVPFCPLFLH